MFPSDTFTLLSDKIQFDPIYNISDNPTEFYSYGGIALNNASEGLMYQKWKAHVNIEGKIFIGNEAEGYVSSSPFAVMGQGRVSLGFDNNMAPIIGLQTANQFLIRYFETLTQQYETKTITGTRCGMLTIDDPRDGTEAWRDVVAIYIRNSDNMLCYRLFRERYDVENEVMVIDELQTLYKIGMTVERSFRFQLVWDTDRIIKATRGCL